MAALELEKQEKSCPFCDKQLSKHAPTALLHVNSMCSQRKELSITVYDYNVLPNHKKKAD